MSATTVTPEQLALNVFLCTVGGCIAIIAAILIVVW